MDEAYSWSAAFERFYGRDYCLRMSMDLERLHDQQYQGSHFRFQEGWVVPTLDLLNRLRALGLPLRTRDHIIVHLCSPVETMCAGEFYLQVGRQLPGRLSLKFTRRNMDGSVIIQPTVLEPEEERRLASNPCRYVENLRENARMSDGQKLLTTIVLLSNRCETLRLHAITFLQRLCETNDEWIPVNYPRQLPRALDNYSSLPCVRPDAVRERRSGSEGNITTRAANHSAGEPEENDETSPNHKPSAPRAPQPYQNRSSITDDYTGVDEGISSSDFRRRSSGGSSTGGGPVVERAFLRDDYAGMTEAIASLNLTNTPQRRPNFQHQISPPPTQYTDQYVGVGAGVGVAGHYSEPPPSLSWISHHHNCNYLPITVEEVNRMGDTKATHSSPNNYSTRFQ